MEPILKIEHLDFYYDKIQALEKVFFEVYPGEIVTMIGSNGAGKTTLLRSISGLLGKIGGGSITFEGQRIDKLPPHHIAALRLGQVLEGRLVFPQLTVKENLMMGAFLQKDNNFIKGRLEYCYNLFPRLKERESQNAGTLSGGEQQMVAVARALMGTPKLLMLDEPSMGLAPLVIKDIFSTIEKINKDGVTILLVEQNAKSALKIANRAYVMEIGKLVMEGSAEEFIHNDSIKKTYLGIS
ncbi:MAG TPA: ABC transporter ATP-binding protein [Clostridiales bacterium]|nr:ABC transporter ATP-binding protein [Clostridiales bacterium]